MQTLIVVVLAVGVFLVVARAMRTKDGPRRLRGPRPGEDLPGIEMLPAPDGLVTLRASMPAPEAYIARGLLTSNGIAAEVLLLAMRPYTPEMAGPARLLVAADRVAEAEALLAAEYG